MSCRQSLSSCRIIDWEGLCNHTSNCPACDWESGRNACCPVNILTFSVNLKCWKWKDHLSAAPEECALALDQVVTEMPGEDEEVVRFHGVRFELRDNRDVRARSEATEFVFIHFGNRWKQLRSDPAMLQKDISLGRS